MPRNNKNTPTIKPEIRHKKRKRRRFVDYSIPMNFNKLSKRQKFYVKTMATHFKLDIRNMSREDYLSLPTEMRKSVLDTTEKILSGDKFRELQSVAVDNYISGLNYYGAANLAGKLNLLRDALTETDLEKLMVELPGLYLFYKDKRDATPLGRGQGWRIAHLKRDIEITDTDITFQLEEAERVIDEWFEEYSDKIYPDVKDED